jgi:hypothetical protein
MPLGQIRSSARVCHEPSAATRAQLAGHGLLAGQRVVAQRPTKHVAGRRRGQVVEAGHARVGVPGRQVAVAQQAQVAAR